MQDLAKALKFAVVGFAAVILLTLSTVQFGVPGAKATPAIAQGKACNACHTSSTPSKNDIKK
jgi:hypothetical protein